MVIPDVNVVIGAFRADHAHHETMRQWLSAASLGTETLGILDFVLSSMVRITTSLKFMSAPASLDEALTFAEGLRHEPSATVVVPGPRHWSIFRDLCLATVAQGNRVPDAYLAAIAIEAGATFVTVDSGFARFPGLRLVNPLHD